jgi:hypothetical protein
MQITISFRSGFSVDGVILSATETRLRVAMRDWDDAAEFQFRDGQWFAENRDPVYIAWPDSQPGNNTLTLAADKSCGRTGLPSSHWVN